MGFLINFLKELSTEFKIENDVLIDYHGRGGDVVVPDNVINLTLVK